MESAKNPHQSDSDCRDRSRLGDYKPRPGIQKSCKRTIPVAHVNILSTRLRLKRTKLSIGERTEDGEDAADNPCKVNQLSRANCLHHLFWNEKDATTDNCPHDNGDRVAQAERARKQSPSCSNGRFMHAPAPVEEN